MKLSGSPWHDPVYLGIVGLMTLLAFVACFADYRRNGRVNLWEAFVVTLLIVLVAFIFLPTSHPNDPSYRPKVRERRGLNSPPIR